MKRIISLLLVIAIVVAMVPTAMAAKWTDTLFDDVKKEDWFYNTVKTAYELGLMSGYGDGIFGPKGEITLAETVTIAARIHAIYNETGEKFNQKSPWYQVYVDYAEKNGIIDNTDYEWSKAATRIEFAEILSRSLPKSALKEINKVDDGAIPDVKKNDAVYLLYRAGILIGADDKGSFLPNNSISRCEVATIASRMLVASMRESVTLTNNNTTPSSGNIQNGGNTSAPTTSNTQTDALDENNAITEPFDLVYPDLFASGELAYSGEHIIIKLADRPNGKKQVELYNAGVTSLDLMMDLGDGKWYKAYVDGDVNEVMEKVRAINFVLIAEYDFAYESESIIECTPEELPENINGNPRYDEQWYLRSCGLKKGWEHIKNPHYRPGYDGSEGEDNVSNEAGEGIVVAVIDTGVDYTHTDLKDNIWVNKGEIPDDGKDNDGNGYIDDYYGYDAVAGKGSGMDDHGHGTHVAGIIAAANNNTGIVGIAYNAKIMPIKAGMASGYFNSSDIAEAIKYAADNGADVINMSFGGSASTTFVEEALTYAYPNCILVAAAGNDGLPNEEPKVKGWDFVPTYPAALSNVIGVMSVNEYGVESGFTNWDAAGFNSIEYEVYAPGEQMLSTIPGNRYASWDGTSMAAPVVSAAAALLRAEYRDNATYPTKFIYGQICGTTTKNAYCMGFDEHGPHNLPGILNLYNALTVLPTPDVSIQGGNLFDTVGLMGNEKNNGDGVIDAGETLAIGFTLRNKWGKSTDTVVSVNTDDPYITIHTDSVNYGEVGTYSTQDAGKIITNGVFIGWENPFYITISPDCPNDYIFTLNIDVSCKNGLDADDSAVYSDFSYSLDNRVRRGAILEGTINKDTVLTADNNYIIANALFIPAGVTVTVEPGTQIQFWSNPENDPYADAAMVSLTVEGTLNFEGTIDKRIKLFPGERLREYLVEITQRNGGRVTMKYTDVINPDLKIDYAENCYFTQNERNEPIVHRTTDGSTIINETYCAEINILFANNCSFELLGSKWDWYRLSGEYTGCLFSDCRLYNDYAVVENWIRYENCVFYGNNNYRGEKDGGAYSINLCAHPYFRRSSVDVYEGTTYVNFTIGGNADIYMLRGFAKYLGGHLVSINNAEELEFLNANVAGEYIIGLEYNPTNGEFVWADGTEVDATIFSYIDYPEHGPVYKYVSSKGGVIRRASSLGDVTIEIPGQNAENNKTKAEQIDFTDTKALDGAWKDYVANSINESFYGNAIINRISTESTNKWLRVGGAESSSYLDCSITGNYWGTTDMYMVNKQIFDFNVDASRVDLNPGEILTTAPENVWPFVVKAGLVDGSGNEVSVIGNETVTFYVEFNRDMDTSVPLDVRFGSAYPYADYQVEGEYVSARRWEGTTTLTTLIEAGYQFWSIDNARAADDHALTICKDWGRFTFEIDTTSALAMVLQGEATDEGVNLTWMQDDYPTLAGYNVYRADKDEDGYYQRLNPTVIPVGEETWFDDTVEPGKVYYYIFTVVKTDLTESEPSGKKMIMSKDTMSPIVYHTPVYKAYEGSNVVVSATATDNVALQSVKLHYCVGDGEWKSVEMSKLNDKYSAVISGGNVTLDGIKYYIAAYDGVSYTYKGGKSEPYAIVVQEDPGEQMMGDVNGDGRVTILDALKLLRAANNKEILDDEQFARADLNGDKRLSAAEALVILKYANGEIGSLAMV